VNDLTCRVAGAPRIGAVRGSLMLVESVLTLGLVPVRLPAVEVTGGRRAERRFLDFLVGGQQLGRLVAERARLIDLANTYASVLVTNWPAGFDAQAVRQLLGQDRPPLADGRIPLYVCAECGGLGCGTITVVIERASHAVTCAASDGRQITTRSSTRSPLKISGLSASQPPAMTLF
jgi:hypothetical protein